MAQQPQTGTVRETGVPLGGVDTGYVEVYPNGTWSDLRLPGAAARTPARIMSRSFAALRVQHGAGVWTRLLADAAAVPPSASGTQPEGLPASACTVTACHPKVSFALNDPGVPVTVNWTWHSSLVPFDHDASCMPALFMRAELQNNAEERVKCSVLLNMAPPPMGPGEPFHTILPLLVEYEDNVRLRPEDGSEFEEFEHGPVRNAVIFGDPPDGPGPALEACMAVRAWNARLTTAAWNPLNAIEEARLWEDFAETGRLPRVAVSRAPSHGAVCCDFWMNPGEHRRVFFVYAWYHRLPPDQAPAYAALWGGVCDVTRHGLRHADYLLGAVDNWHGRLLDAESVPAWLGTRLVQSTSAFTRGGALAVDGAFHWRTGMDSAGPADRFDLCLPVMLFFPRFEAAALSSYALAEPPATTADEAAAFALSAYRDYLHTGNLSHLQEFWPAVRRDATALLLNPPAAPATAGPAGRRVAALRAAVHLAEAMHDPVSTGLFDACRRAWVEYETRFWDKKTGLYGAPGEDPAAAMSGLCHVAALRMDDVAQPERVARCLNTLAKDRRADALPTASLVRLAFLERHYAAESAAGGVWSARLNARLDRDPVFDARLLWPLFQAMGGMLYAVPAQRVYIDPRPGPRGAETAINLMTPLCFGRMRHLETQGTAGPEMQVDLLLDSPVILRDLVLRVPEGMVNPMVRCTVNEENIPCEVTPRTEMGRGDILLRFGYPVQLADTLSIFVRETAVQKKRWGWLR